MHFLVPSTVIPLWPVKIKSLILLVVAFILVLVWHNWDLLQYGISMGKGQFRLLTNSIKVEKLLDDPLVSDSVKDQLRLIAEIKNFGENKLGLNAEGTYESCYTEDNPMELYVVTAAEKFRLNSYEWEFPFIGKVPYKGFFNEAEATREAIQLSERGFDTDVGKAGGWSTLGWFSDPILPGMLKKEEGSLASLILHEMLHGTVYVKDSTDFNENFANFVGEQGARYFLEWKYGKNSHQVNSWLNELREDSIVNDYFLKGTQGLQEVYDQLEGQPDTTIKLTFRETFFNDFKAGLDSLQGVSENRKKRIQNWPLNNTHFLEFLRYDGRKKNFIKQSEISNSEDLKQVILGLQL